MIPCWAEGSGFRLTQNPDSRQKRLDDLYEYGKKKGTLTYKEIMERLMDLYIEPDQLDKVLENLEALGVTVINENDPQPAQSSEDTPIDTINLSVPDGVSSDDPVRLYLKEIGKYLVEVHGQFDNQGLLNPANHRDVLDAYAGYKDLLAEVAGKFAAYKTAKTARIEAENDVARARSDEEALRHWVDELEKIAPEAGEEETLGKKRLEMMNAEKIIESPLKT